NYFCDCFGGMKQHEWIAEGNWGQIPIIFVTALVA
ncbi:MAG: hypothetical protein RIR92_1393, partial [Pseudomonadota bacterium]